MKKHVLRVLLCCALMTTPSLFAQDKPVAAVNPMLSDLSIDMQWFLSYMNGETAKVPYNQFILKRGYVNIKKKINHQFSGRITTDLTVDKEGDGKGDVEIRLKYLYLKYQLPTLGFIYKPYFEFGLVHRPWIDFEQSINKYRVQGKMFLERNKVVSSADYGIFFHTLLGGEMDAQYKKEVNKKYAGAYGSFAIGIFNGGGYHALEMNESKSFESRLTLRPLKTVLPGLQLSCHGAVGKGNIPEEPDWTYGSAYLSYERKDLVLTGELYQGEGNYKGSAVQDEILFEAIPQTGHSVFGELKLFNRKISLMSRYDTFTEELNNGDLTTERLICGIAYHFVHGSKILLAFDQADYSNTSKANDHLFEIAIELKY